MPDPDLVAYLDGEADAEAVRRIEASWADDPALRAEALALMRQRAALSRLLPELAGRQPRQPRRHPGRPWWLPAVVGIAAAAGIVIAVLIYGSTVPAVPAPGPGPVAVAPVHPPAPPSAFADDAAWRPGAEVAGAGRAVALADGTRLTLASGALLRIADPAHPWQLAAGSLACEQAAPALPVAETLATVEAECRPTAGRWEVRRDAQGTVVRVAAGQVRVRDVITGATEAVAAGAEYWVPADLAAPREEADAAGIVRGTVVDIETGGRAVVLRTRFGTTRLTPDWVGGVGGRPNADMAERLRKLHPGDRVVMNWKWSEHLRIRGFDVLRAGAGPPEPEAVAPPSPSF